MKQLPRLFPVVELRYFQPGRLFPWPVAVREPNTYVRLSPELDDGEVGLVMALLVSYNHLRKFSQPNRLFRRVISADDLILPGGLQAVQGECEINPSCCCGLEGWREWHGVLESCVSPWLGHDPSPWVEVTGDTARVWSDGGLGEQDRGDYIDFPLDHLEQELRAVELALKGFLQRMESWASGLHFAEAPALVRRLDQALYVTHETS